MTIRIASLAAITSAAMLLAGPAFAETLNMTAELSGAAEVPANDSAGTGTLEATYDTETMLFTWTVTYEGLTGDATAAHFHGPAAADATAGPVIPIEGDLASPIEGSATLTEEQATQLQDGLWYFNVHTEANKGGEIRGQVTKG